MRAAAATVPGPEQSDGRGPFLAHSLHAYFIRGGDADEPIRFEVDRLRNGRSFVTRQVVARQSGGAILNLSCSFQADEDEAEVQTGGLPDVPPPDPDGRDTSWGPLIERRNAAAPTAGVARTWLRVVGPLDDDPVVHQCALAYASDDAPMEAAITHHPRWVGDDETDFGRFMTASLDHSVWFHRPVQGDAWHLYDLHSDGIRGGRGMSFGRVLTLDGTHVASIAQEVLIREVRR